MIQMLSGYRTIIASVISIIASVAAMFGIDIPLAEQELLGNQIIGAVSAAAAIYFRVTATKVLSDTSESVK